MVCTAVAELDPQAFVASTLTPYDPGPAVPLNVRLVVEKLPTNAPVTFSTYRVGAGPLAGVSHTTKTILPTRYARKPAGVSGAPEQEPGNVTVTAFDGALVPAAFVALTLSV